MNDNTMKLEVDEKLLAALQSLADKLGTTAEHLWSVLTTQAYMEGWICVITAALSLFLTVLVCVVSVVTSGTRRSSDAEEAWAMVAITSGILAALVLGVSAVSASSWITHINNPEYWALKEVMSAVAK